MHIRRSDRSLDFIARGCSFGMLLLHLPVVVLIVVLGLLIAEPMLVMELTIGIFNVAQTLGMKAETLLHLCALVPLLQALLLHSNRRHGIGGGRWILYNAVFVSPAVLCCLYYAGLLLLSATPCCP